MKFNKNEKGKLLTSIIKNMFYEISAPLNICKIDLKELLISVLYATIKCPVLFKKFPRRFLQMKNALCYLSAHFQFGRTNFSAKE